MWWRSASFIMDRQQNDAAWKADSSHSITPPPASPTNESSISILNPNPNPNANPRISAYYQTRAAHHGVVTSDWLAQAQAAIGPEPEPEVKPDPDKPFSVIDEFNNWRKQPHLAEAVAAIRALAAVIRSSEATTMMELEIELKKASDSLKVTLVVILTHSISSFFVHLQLLMFFFCFHLQSWDTTSISLTAGCDLFMRYVTRTSALEYENFNSAKSRLIERAEKFGEISYKATCFLPSRFHCILSLFPHTFLFFFFLQARKIIAMLSQEFIFDGCTILVHGFSRVVFEVLKLAAQNKKLFRVFCTEGRPDRTGLRLSNELAKLDVPVKLVIDSAVAYTMDVVDMVFVGADGVVESGGIINMMGTYQIALVAHSMNKPVYVAAESYKFARLYPLDQKDLAPALRPIDFGVPIPPKVEVERSARDYTPPQYLTLLFTDLGVLTPSVVSDELIQLYL
ncbi:translation initiation factor eIF-2B subunit alpha-like isoform X1 [Abrus precatorius]|uniref:Translation initiation factor eIF2B subunit alpha n=1 Tax=Abrus precatorius TaxID=3816 RepID=A0A8B8L741_ABRPR|nr:translation initiation factor eIF-2B subunit alpha-like isoform X1 [Abrus precatorius]